MPFDPSLYPLNNQWQIYYLPQGWQDFKPENIEKLAQFDNIAHFWGSVNHIMERIENSECTGHFFVFKSRSYPLWEHPSNEKGHRWEVKIGFSHNTDEQQYITAKQTFLKMTNELLIYLIGGDPSTNQYNGLEFCANDDKQYLFLRLWIHKSESIGKVDATAYLPTHVIPKQMYHDLVSSAPTTISFVYQ